MTPATTHTGLNRSVILLIKGSLCHFIVEAPGVRRGDVLCLRICRLALGPPLTTMVGISTLAAPMTEAGVVLSQPAKQDHAIYWIGTDRFFDIHTH